MSQFVAACLYLLCSFRACQPAVGGFYQIRKRSRSGFFSQHAIESILEMSGVAGQNITFVPFAAVEHVVHCLGGRPLVILNTLINTTGPAGEHLVPVVDWSVFRRGAATDSRQGYQQAADGNLCELHELCLIGTRDGTFMFILSALHVISESGVSWGHSKMRPHPQIAGECVSLFALVPALRGFTQAL